MEIGTAVFNFVLNKRLAGIFILSEGEKFEYFVWIYRQTGKHTHTHTPSSLSSSSIVVVVIFICSSNSV